jgi:hypothetical protein
VIRQARGVAVALFRVRALSSRRRARPAIPALDILTFTLIGRAAVHVSAEKPFLAPIVVPLAIRRIDASTILEATNPPTALETLAELPARLARLAGTFLPGHTVYQLGLGRAGTRRHAIVRTGLADTPTALNLVTGVDHTVSERRTVRPIHTFAVGLAGIGIQAHAFFAVSGVTVVVGLAGLFGLTRPIGTFVPDDTLVIDSARVRVCALTRIRVAHPKLTALRAARVLTAGRPQDAE